MTSVEPRPAASPPPPRRPFQFGLRTLLLLFVVLGSSMAVFGAWGILVFALVVGLAVYLRNAESPLTLAQFLFVVFLLGGLIALLMPLADFHEVGRLTTCRNNLKQIVSALLNYEQVNGSLPPAYTVDSNGKPIHSWRTLILPGLERSDLYNAYDFTKPWDSPNNKALSSAALRIYMCPSDYTHYNQSGAMPAAPTSYFAVVGPNAAWAGDKPRKLADFGDQASHTIMLVEVADSGVSRAEPKDVSLNTLGAAGPNSAALTPSSHHGGRPEDFFFFYDYGDRLVVAMADGSVRVISIHNLSPEQLRRLFEIGGCTDEALGRDGGVTRRPNWPNIAALVVWLVSVGALLTAAVRGRRGRSEMPSPKD